jgi:erythromycin esterase
MRSVVAVLVPLAVLLLPPFAPAQPDTLSRTQRIEALRVHVHPIRSIAPSDTNFSDLAPLKNAIGDRKMVMLGEPTHGDGSVFRAKSRLVRFLHEEMDFGVLAFESGLYDLRAATDSADTPDAYLQAAVDNLSRPWAKSEQARPALRYAAQTQTSDDPLHLAGIDIALRPPRDSVFAARLERHLRQKDLWTDLNSEFDFGATLRKQLANPLYRPDSATYRRFTDALTTAQTKLAGGSTADAFWAQMTENVHAMARTAWQRSYDPRNEQMADNLVWLAETGYPDEKVIVWVASSHGIRNLSSIERINAKRSYEGRVSMGDVLADRFDGGIYTLGFTAHEGTYGAFYWERREEQSISAPSRNSLEDLLGALPHDYSLLDFTSVPDDHWLARPQVARPLGYEEMRADWTQVMDGLLFTRTMGPNTKISE